MFTCYTYIFRKIYIIIYIYIYIYIYISYHTTPEVFRKFLCLLPSKFSNSPDGIPKGLLKKLSF